MYTLFYAVGDKHLTPHMLTPYIGDKHLTPHMLPPYMLPPHMVGVSVVPSMGISFVFP